jgi:hypothetical protein
MGRLGGAGRDRPLGAGIQVREAVEYRELRAEDGGVGRSDG